MSHTKLAQIGSAARLLQLAEVRVLITLSIQLLAVAGIGAFREQTLLVQDRKQARFGRIDQLHTFDVVEVLDLREQSRK